VTWPEFPSARTDEVGALLYGAYERHFLALARHLPPAHRQVFVQALEHEVIGDLKHVIRRIVGGRARRPGDEGRYMTLGRSALIGDVSKVGSLDELDGALDGTVYAAPYRLARATFEDSREILAFEVALDLDYHRRLARAIRRLPHEDAEAVGRLFRHQCDIKNMGWILRYRFDFELTEVEIFNYTLTHGYELDDDLVMELARQVDTDRVLATVAHLPIGRFIQSHLPPGPSHPSVIDIEAALDRYWEHIHRQSLCRSPFGLLPFMCYQVLKELERDRLRRVIVGLQLDLSPDDILDGLWLTTEAAHV